MKKRLSLLIMALLFLTSCSAITGKSRELTPVQSNDESASTMRESYDILILPGVEGGVFKESFLYPEVKSREEEISNPGKTTIGIGATEYEVYKIRTIYADENVTDVYGSENGKYEYMVSRNSNSFRVTAKDDEVLVEFGFEELNADNLLKRIKDYFLSLIPDENLEKYSQNCKTMIVVQNHDSAWGEGKDFFYVPNNGESSETVRSYVFDFRLFSQGLRTSDCITVRCEANGDLKSVEYFNCGVDWDLAKIDINSVRGRINDFISSAIADEYLLKSLSILSESLTFADSKIRLLFECELTLESNGAEIVVLCPLIITP